MFLKAATTGLLLLVVLACENLPRGQAPGSQPPTQAGDYHIYFGDLHNHSNVGYARGSMQRAFEIAQSQLDFFAFTPHGYWHDIGHYENNIEERWHRGFEVTRERWPDVLATAARFDAPGTFVPLVGFEWHSSSIGDYHIIFPDLAGPYVRFDDIRELQQFARQHGAIMIPHHPANRLGHRGANLAWLDPELSPVIEIYSEWGSAEHDRAPFPYIRHSHGGRWTRNTFQHFLTEGYRLGVIASTDDHLGYPGAYREGLAAVLTTDLTRAGIFDALRNRRTYAVTGDRIRLDFRLNGHLMGRELPYTRQRELAVTVTGWDQIDRVEILKNNRVIHRDFPVDRLPTAASWDQPVLVRVEYGWGPWAALNADRVFDWDMMITVEDGVLEDVQTAFQSGPFDEDRRDRIVSRGDHHLRVQSYTARRQQMDDISTKAVVLKMRGGPDTRLKVNIKGSTEAPFDQTFRQLANSGEIVYIGEYPNESVMIHRLVFQDRYHTSYHVSDVDGGKEVNWYYLRVVQANGQLAWSSPIWVEPRAAGR